MNVTNLLTAFMLCLLAGGCSGGSDESTAPAEVPSSSESMYFPPSDSDTWETKSLSSLGWHQDKVQDLLNYLDTKHSRSFMILQNGRIVMENYFSGHTASTPWYWASAGKTLTSALTGIAQQEGFLNIDNKVSAYLGTGWTSAHVVKEN